MLEAARDLYGLPPAGFTAARNQLVKALKVAGSADDAAVVATLRRPRLAEWALNCLAREQAEVVAELVQAIIAAQRAQSAAIGGVAAGLREATNELRRATGATADAAVRLLSAAGANGEAQRDDLTTIIRELVGNADPGPLVAGVIGSEALVSSGEFFPGAPDPAPRTELKRPEPKRPELTLVPSAPGPTATAEARRAMVRAERFRLEQELHAAETAERKAATAVEESKAELARRKAALQQAAAATRSALAALGAFDATQ